MSSPGQETLRGASPLNSSPSLSLDHASLLRRDALLSPLNLNLNLSPPPLPKFLGGEEQDQQDESDIELDESKEDVPVEEPKDSGETKEEESSDVEEEKSRDWVDQVEAEVKKEATKKLVVETEQKQAVLPISPTSRKCQMCVHTHGRGYEYECGLPSKGCTGQLYYWCIPCKVNRGYV